MANQNSLDKTYIEMAKCWAQLSHANRKKVGCLIVKNGAIISDGYNGTPSGFDNVCEQHNFILSSDGETVREETVTKPEVLHAESNAISKLAKSTQSSDGATLYATCSPCLDCAKLIIQCGIDRVVYSEQYRIDDGLKLLKKANIKLEYFCE
jgi:dCMP deaminase|tara:strand:- start:739 stop:1194 length:456 start_codon:yes stop_codon:yes gene_type:complete